MSIDTRIAKAYFLIYINATMLLGEKGFFQFLGDVVLCASHISHFVIITGQWCGPCSPFVSQFVIITMLHKTISWLDHV